MPARAAHLPGAGLSPRARHTLSLLCGAALALAAAPFDQVWAIAFIAGVLTLSSGASTARSAAWSAWWSASGYFAVSLHWIVEPFLVDAALTGWMAPFALVLLAGGLALFWGLPAYLAARLTAPGLGRAALLAGLLTLAEYARGHVLTGFPWAQPGHLLIGWTPVFPTLAATGGAILMTAAVLAIGLLGTALASLPRRAPALVAALAWGLATTLGNPAPGPAPQANADVPTIRLIQPNAAQHLKWRPDMIPVFFTRALDLTAAVPDGPAPDLIVWPETSLPVLIERSERERAAIAQASGTAPVILGGQRVFGGAPRNSALHLDPAGAVRDVYDKHHLVPFGEYLPFGDTLARVGLTGFASQLAGIYRPGPGPVTWDLGPRLGTVFPMICYEAIFPGYIHEVARPDWLLHLTNDAWFGRFSGPFQHLALARLRAAEQGLPVLRAANTGVSAVIDGRGRIMASLPLDTAGFLDAHLPPALPPTLYARWGDAPALVIVLILTAFAGRAGTRAPLRP